MLTGESCRMMEASPLSVERRAPCCCGCSRSPTCRQTGGVTVGVQGEEQRRKNVQASVTTLHVMFCFCSRIKSSVQIKLNEMRSFVLNDIFRPFFYFEITAGMSASTYRIAHNPVQLGVELPGLRGPHISQGPRMHS